MRDKTVTDQVRMHYLSNDGLAIPCMVRLSYTTAAQFEVLLRIDVADGIHNDWRFSREVLGRGVYEPAGLGDVRVWPVPGSDGAETCISVSGACRQGVSHAVFLCRATDLLRFLIRTYKLVVPGHEVIDFDDALADLLSGE
ncbi:SsgA family sporulation/cell division regulator [Streptomyces pathocidini]|uniref:SsgA family sporulation/cell division regulator n=1 Tax=Streptomyces pathocidini TaxID=1650571 RepID=A0ABW7UV00_9ACTN|nr:SsgA family sporulation/cell division regulator [Streptomyces pathocidini]